MPDTICIACENNLELLTSFRNICIQSFKTQKLRIADRLDIKTEEVILDDLIWEDEIGINPLPNICDSSINENESYGDTSPVQL